MLNTEATEIRCSMSDLEIADSEIWSFLGYKDKTPDEYMLGFISKLKAEAMALCQPRFGYKLFSQISINKSKSVSIGATDFEPGAIITHALKKSEHFILLLASIGPELNNWLEEQRKSDDILDGFVSDALGSTIVEAIAAYAKIKLEAELSPQGQHISNTYSPGYCGWHVSEQQKLFALLPEHFCQVSLTKSSLMLPIKSVSAIIGVGPQMEYKDYGCALCNKKDCYKRRLK